MLVLDAALTGAKGTNLWTQLPRRSTAAAHRALYARSWSAGSRRWSRARYSRRRSRSSTAFRLTASRDVPLATLEAAALEAIEAVRRDGSTPDEVSRAKRQLNARLVFEMDSVTSLAHQLGYFETTVGSGFFETLRPCVEAVTVEQVADVARRRLGRETQTVGSFQPVTRCAERSNRGAHASPSRARERRRHDRPGDGVLPSRHDCRRHTSRNRPRAGVAAGACGIPWPGD